MACVAAIVIQETPLLLSAIFADISSQGFALGAVIAGVIVICVSLMGIIGGHIIFLIELRGMPAKLIGLLGLVAGVMLVMYGVKRM